MLDYGEPSRFGLVRFALIWLSLELWGLLFCYSGASKTGIYYLKWILNVYSDQYQQWDLNTKSSALPIRPQFNCVLSRITYEEYHQLDILRFNISQYHSSMCLFLEESSTLFSSINCIHKHLTALIQCLSLFFFYFKTTKIWYLT